LASPASYVDPDLLFGDLVAQDLTSLYGKILRIDVDRGAPYRIPRDNPFVDHDSIPGEIYAWGFRNPFRISFDRKGDRAIYVSAPADTLFEATYKGTRPGNFGWAVREGTHCIVRTSAFAPPETIKCSSDVQCPIGPRVSTSGAKGRVALVREARAAYCTASASPAAVPRQPTPTPRDSHGQPRHRHGRARHDGRLPVEPSPGRKGVAPSASHVVSRERSPDLRVAERF
jgi:hypothetical protein